MKDSATEALTSRFIRHVGQTSPFPTALVIDRAQGCWIVDASGKRCLDCIAGIAVCNAGHSHPAIVGAVTTQMASYAHTMVYGEHVQRPQVELAEAIVSVAPPGLDSVYFLTTGAEANDAALKMAVKLTGRARIVAFHGAYHGDTVGALACFGMEKYRRGFAPLLPAVDFLPFGDPGALQTIGSDTAAVIVEPVQGEAGIVIPPPGYLAALRDRCAQAGAMLVFDEVQTGFGRTGAWFAACREGVVPDVITMAKAMGGGLPLAGLLASRAALNAFAAAPPFSHITTFGGNPVCCAAGLASWRAIRDEGLIENARAMGALLMVSLRETANATGRLTDVRGIGLMIGAELDPRLDPRRIVDGCRDRGLIVETTLLNERVVRFSPPLTIARDECRFAIDTFRTVLQEAV